MVPSFVKLPPMLETMLPESDGPDNPSRLENVPPMFENVPLLMMLPKLSTVPTLKVRGNTVLSMVPPARVSMVPIFFRAP